MSQLTDAQLITEATVIKTETALGANTADRVGTMFVDSINSKINIDVIDPNIALGTSDALIPTQNAVKKYADGLVVGLLDDRGNYTPGTVSGAASPYPSTGGSGAGNTIRKGDLWFIAANGFLNTTAVTTGFSVRALVDNAGALTDANWNILNTGFAFTPENVANKSTDINLGTSNTLYPTQNAVKQYVSDNAALIDGQNTFSTNNFFDGDVFLAADTEFSGDMVVKNNGITFTDDARLYMGTDPGTVGQVLTSQGGTATPTWETPTPGISLADNNTFTGDNTFTQSTEFTAGLVSPVGGTAQFNGTVDINGFFKLDGQSGTAGQVLKSQGAATPIWGDASVLPYKVYTVLLNNTFSGGFTQFVLQDTITSVGTTLSWSDNGNGIFNLNATGSSPFTANKTWVVIGQSHPVSSYLQNIFPDEIYIKTPTGQYIQNLSIEIRVYL